MKTKHYKTLSGGLTCREVNPHPYEDTKLIRSNPLIIYKKANKLYDDFEATAPTIAITEVMPECETFSGESVLQWECHYDAVNSEWFDVEEGQIMTGLTTRIAIKPLKAIELPSIEFDSNVLNPDNYDEDGNPLVDVVENKVETVDGAAEKAWYFQFENGVTDPTFDTGFRMGANWQQSQSIEGIVGFVLEWVADYAKRDITKDGLERMKQNIVKKYTDDKI